MYYIPSDTVNKWTTETGGRVVKMVNKAKNVIKNQRNLHINHPVIVRLDPAPKRPKNFS